MTIAPWGTYPWGKFLFGGSYWISPIYDRTQSDVDEALSIVTSIKSTGVIPQSFLDGLKGSVNYTDLNRIENNCDYLSKWLVGYGYTISITTKLDWEVDDLITREDVDRIRGNVESLLDCYYTLVEEQPVVYNNTLDYNQLNTLEYDLYILNLYFNAMVLGLRYSGEFSCGE